MKRRHLLVPPLMLLILLCGCTNSAARQDPAAAADGPDRGMYLVNLLACGRCHTEGFLTGSREAGPPLAGSTVGIAYTPDREGVQPGLAFASNLTPDPETGLGNWTEAEIMRAMTSGVGKYGHRRLPVMPWANYTALTQSDLRAIARYLRKLPPVSRRIPASTSEGEPSRQPYVRFGVYTFDPQGRVRARDLP
jgi:cytochrome c553